MAIAYVAQLLLGSISSMDRHDAALRAADTDDSIPGPLIFDPPDSYATSTTPPSHPTSDSMRLAALFTKPPTSAAANTNPQNNEGRA